jgi:transcriptional regulator with XRE-family HTH domain
MKTTKQLTELKITKSQIDRLAENLQLLLNENSFSENELAQALDIPVMTIRRIASKETVDPRISTLKLIADYFNVTVDSLIDGQKPVKKTNENAPRFIPILDWVTLSRITTFKDVNLLSWQEWHPIVLEPQYSLGESAFALESRPSMQPRFPKGTLFIIDPEEKPTDGDVILIKMKDSSELSLRELIIDPPKWQLQPVVAGSETLFYNSHQHEILGVVMLTMLYNKK